MPDPRPSRATLLARSQADLKLATNNINYLRPGSIEFATAAMAAGSSHSLYGYIERESAQIVPGTSKGRALLRWAAIWFDGMAPLPASKAAGQVQFTASDGTAYVVDDIVNYASGGTSKITVGDVAAGGFATVTVQADLAGTSGNIPEGASMFHDDPPPGDTGGGESFVQAGGISGGTEAETLEAFATRFYAALRVRETEGSTSEYHRWALDVDGITRALVTGRHNGAGTVFISLISDQLTTVMPTSAKAKEVLDYIRDSTRAAPEAMLTVTPVLEELVDVAVRDILPNDAATEAEVTAQLEDLFIRSANFGESMSRDSINTAIAASPRHISHTLDTPVASVTTPLFYNVNWLGAVTFPVT